jgi:SET domain-containing protein
MITDGEIALERRRAAEPREPCGRVASMRSRTEVLLPMDRGVGSCIVIPPMIERRKSKIAGWGVYATQVIPKNTRIVHYAGEKITHKESLEREQKYLGKGRIWCFTLNRRWVIDAGVGGNIARFVNHSCRPNCWIEIKNGVIWIRASRTLRTGEELTYNYNTSGDAEIPCRCRPGCTHKI